MADFLASSETTFARARRFVGVDEKRCVRCRPINTPHTIISRCVVRRQIIDENLVSGRSMAAAFFTRAEQL